MLGCVRLCLVMLGQVRSALTQSGAKAKHAFHSQHQLLVLIVLTDLRNVNSTLISEMFSIP